MPSAVFDPAITTIERPQTYGLDLHGQRDRAIKYLRFYKSLGGKI